VLARLQPVLARRMQSVLSAQTSSRLRILHEALTADEARGPGLRRIPVGMLRSFTTRLVDLSISGIAAFLTSQGRRFIAAADDTKDGVTLRITIGNLGLLDSLKRALSMKAQSNPASAPAASDATPTVTVDVTPGLAHA
jgi:hypothetical protein